MTTTPKLLRLNEQLLSATKVNAIKSTELKMERLNDSLHQIEAHDSQLEIDSVSYLIYFACDLQH